MFYERTVYGRTEYGQCAREHAPDGAVEISQAGFDAAVEAWAKASVSMAPDRCSKLGLKRALAEIGADAVFPQPEWSDVKDAIEADDELSEDWSLATVILRSDKLVQAMISARKYDDDTVDRILVRANQLAA